MNSMWKRSFALLLSLVLVFGMIPVNTFAEDSAEHTHSYVEGVCECGAAEHTHSHESVVTAPTCTEAGYTTYTCSCGDSYTAEEVAATGHSYTDGVCACGAEEPAEEEEPEEELEEKDEEETDEVVCDGTENCAAEEHAEACLKAAAEAAAEAAAAEASAQRVAEAQALIDALSTEFFVTEREAKLEAYNACTAVIAALTEDERAQLDLTNYYAAANPQVLELTPPQATVSKLDPVVLAAGGYMTWPNGATDIARPLDIVLNFKAEDTLEEAIAGGYGDWICDFYITLSGIEGDTLVIDSNDADVYMAGNYGSFGWIVIPLAGSSVPEGEAIPIVALYDAKLLYREICESVQDFTAAIRISDKILEENPDFQISLSLRMTNPDNADDYMVIGNPYVYDVNALRSDLPVSIGEQGYVSLTAALNDVQDGDTITLLKDITVSSTIKVEKPVTLDLNGKTITNKVVKGRVFEATADMTINGEGANVVGDATSFGLVRMNNSSLVVNGGTYEFDTDGGAVFKINAGTGDMTLNNVTVDTNAMIIDRSSNISYKNVTINGGSFTSVKTAMAISSTGTVAITNATIESSDGAALEVGGGNATLTGCTISSEGKEGDFSGGIGDYTLAISGNGNMTIAGNGNTIHGKLGVAPSGGTLNIEGGQFNGQVQAWAFSDKTATVNISGGTFTNANPIVKKGDNGKEIVQITGGTFKTGSTVNNVTGYVAMTHEQNMTTGIVSEKVGTDVPNSAGSAILNASTVDNDPVITGITDDNIKDMGSNEDAQVTTGLGSALEQKRVNKLVETMDTAGADKVVLNLEVAVDSVTKDSSSQNVVISYDVTPVLQPVQVDENTKQETPVGTGEPIKTLDAQITFRLPLPAGTTSEYVKVYHKDVYVDTYPVIDGEDGPYIQLKSSTFSPWAVELLPAGAKPVSSIGEGDQAVKYITLPEAVAAAKDGDTIKLLGNVTLTEGLKIEKTITLDLNDQTISANNTAIVDANKEKIEGMVIVAENGALTVKDSGPNKTGNISHMCTQAAISVRGDLVLQSGTINGHYYCVFIRTNGSFTMSGGNIEATGDSYVEIGVAMDGRNTAFTMTGGEIIGTVSIGASIDFQTEVTISGGTIRSGTNSKTALSHGSPGTLIISGDSKIIGTDIGVRMSGGTLIITGGEITSTNESAGAAVYVARIDAHLAAGSYDPNISANISGGKLTGYYALQEISTNKTDNQGNVIGTLGSPDNTAISVTGGTLTGNVESQNVSSFITGGTFTKDPSKYSAERYASTQDENKNTWSVDPAAASVIKKDTDTPVYYDTVANAVKNTENGDTLTIIADTKDASKDVSVTKTESMTITADDNGGVKITGNIPANGTYVEMGVDDKTYRVDEDGNISISKDGVVSGKHVEIQNAKPNYSLVPQMNVNSYLSGTNATLIFESNMLFDTFSKAFIDGSEIVINKDYTAARGSTIITLANARLRTLSAGQHTLTLQDVNGYSVSCYFYVTVNAKADTTNPKTGDQIALPMFVLFSSTAALAVLLMGKKKFF